MLLLGGLSAALVGQNNVMATPSEEKKKKTAEELDNIRQKAQNVMDPDDRTLPCQWPRNTLVYGGCTQKRSAYTENDRGAFTFRITKPLLERNDDIKSLDQAIRRVKDGWVDSNNLIQVPVLPRVDGSNHGFKKSDNGKIERYALLITGEGEASLFPSLELLDAIQYYEANVDSFDYQHFSNTFYEFLQNEGYPDLATDYKNRMDKLPKNKLRQEDAFENDVELMKKTLVRAFDMPREMAVNRLPGKGVHMVHLHKPSKRQLYQVLKHWLGPLQSKNAEVLIFYAGHGSIHKSHGSSTSQGADEGKLWLRNDDPVTENEMKRWFKRHLAKFKYVTVLADTCHSGTLVAQNDTNPFVQRALA